MDFKLVLNARVQHELKVYRALDRKKRETKQQLI